MSLKLEATIEWVAIILELSSYQYSKHLTELIVLRFPVAGDVEGSSQVSGNIDLLQHWKLNTIFTDFFVVAPQQLGQSLKDGQVEVDSEGPGLELYPQCSWRILRYGKANI